MFDKSLAQSLVTNDLILKNNVTSAFGYMLCCIDIVCTVYIVDTIVVYVVVDIGNNIMVAI